MLIDIFKNKENKHFFHDLKDENLLFFTFIELFYYSPCPYNKVEKEISTIRIVSR